MSFFLVQVIIGEDAVEQYLIESSTKENEEKICSMIQDKSYVLSSSSEFELDIKELQLIKM